MVMKSKINENIEKKELNSKENEESSSNNNIDEIIIRYKIENIEYSKDIRIFGNEFVENNKDKCTIKIMIMNLN